MLLKLRREWNGMKTKITAIDLLPYAWFLFLIGTCISPRFKELNNIFYLTLLPLTLIAVKPYFSVIIRTPIYIWLLALSGWIAVSSAWAIESDYSDLKSIGYVIIFITGCALVEESKVLEKWGYLLPVAIGIQLFFSKMVGQRLTGFGPMENPLYAGQFYLFFSWVFLYYKQFHSKKTISILARWLGFLLSAGACYLTQSRSVVFCISLLVLIFLLQQDTFKYHKKTVLTLITLIIASSTALFFTNNWITLPSDNVDYQIYLDADETVLIKYIGIAEPTTPPKVETSQGIEATRQQGSNPRGFLFTANKADNYHLEIKLDQKTIIPWRFIQLHTKNPHTEFQLEEELIPPRAFQFELSFGYRTEIWSIRIQQCLEKPIFGYGFTQSLPIPFQGSFVNDSHNFFLGIIFHGGIIALVIYIGLLATCLYTLCRKQLWPFVTLLVVGIIMTMFDDEKFFSSTRPYWLLLLFPIGKALNASLNQNFLPKFLSLKNQFNEIKKSS